MANKVLLGIWALVALLYAVKLLTPSPMLESLHTGIFFLAFVLSAIHIARRVRQKMPPKE